MSNRIKKIYPDRQGVDQQTIRDRTVQYSTGLNSIRTNKPTIRVGRLASSGIQISRTKKQDDPHHCRCFRILENLTSAKAKLEKIGFGQQVHEEDHGQVFGRILRISEYEQIHVKPMPNGIVEAEIEPPTSYPGAHLNQEHSYSAHCELEQVLNYAKIKYVKNFSIPITCIVRQIKKPVNPTHIITILAIAILAVAVVAVVVALLKRGKK